MGSGQRPYRRKSSSIKYKWVPLEDLSVDAIRSGRDEKKSQKDDVLGESSDLNEVSSRMVSTAELASAVGAMWKVIGHPSVVRKSEKASVGNGEENVCLVGNGSENNKSISVGCSPSMASSDFEILRGIKKKLVCGSWGPMCVSNGMFLENVDVLSPGESRGSDTRNSCGLVYACGSINRSCFTSLRDMLNIGRSEDMKLLENRTAENVACTVDIVAARTVRDNRSYAHVGSYNDSAKCVDLIESTTRVAESISVSRDLDLCADCDGKILPSSDSASGERQQLLDSPVDSSEERSICDVGDSSLSCKDSISDNGVHESEYSSCRPLSDEDISSASFSKKKHGLAGALAGTFVSLSLHPVDTIKTVIQSHSLNQTSIRGTVNSIVSERGLMGLYRGIASNIASSAPTSAIYTFTYETVKAAMLPVLPKKYHSLAHCTAGGCASIATSIIFTPSERIKQQMQVRSHYQNCWNAIVGILEKGGLSSLYTGWSAVLCRNIPHSIIKFYTYERLKKSLLSSSQPHSCLNAWQTLTCGGLAGSTAALFTTPFDVVKTRLQTQMPGSHSQYNGVLPTLQMIAKHEGLRGLYRGLTPRLAMYISQGAIFFSSYEFFKAVFSLDVHDLHGGH